MIKHLLPLLLLIGLSYSQGGGYALNFSESNHVDIGNVLNFTYNDPFSIAYWFKVSSGEEMTVANRAACDAGAGSSGCHRGYSLQIGSTLVFYFINTWASNMLVLQLNESFQDYSSYK